MAKIIKDDDVDKEKYSFLKKETKKWNKYQAEVNHYKKIEGDEVILTWPVNQGVIESG